MPACLHETSAEALPSKAWVENCDTDPDSDIEASQHSLEIDVQHRASADVGSIVEDKGSETGS